ncbi:hypothetical protein K469DRAFT_210775 [Zopfia rhizophila CBS 207.26]|uniref:Uncharacterized protein n=1 Tax=Zopfia rhizophila CBS 207.26 TaxID=1314779 RepID=A0A6A6DWD8_9PEZI|nr:hypothetical protein K469DRAFT_210775 [Zopfia rhizophila CBS 207.26]
MPFLNLQKIKSKFHHSSSSTTVDPTPTKTNPAPQFPSTDGQGPKNNRKGALYAYPASTNGKPLLQFDACGNQVSGPRPEGEVNGSYKDTDWNKGKEKEGEKGKVTNGETKKGSDTEKMEGDEGKEMTEEERIKEERRRYVRWYLHQNKEKHAYMCGACMTNI